MPKSDAYIHSNHADITVCQFNLAHHIPEIIGKTSQFLHNYAEYTKKASNVAMITLMVLLYSHQLPECSLLHDLCHQLPLYTD